MKRFALLVVCIFVAAMMASAYCLLRVRQVGEEMPLYYNRGQQQMWQAEVQYWSIIGVSCLVIAVLSMLVLFIVLPIMRIRRIRQQNDFRVC